MPAERKTPTEVRSALLKQLPRIEERTFSCVAPTVNASVVRCGTRRMVPVARCEWTGARARGPLRALDIHAKSHGARCLECERGARPHSGRTEQRQLGRRSCELARMRSRTPGTSGMAVFQTGGLRAIGWRTAQRCSRCCRAGPRVTTSSQIDANSRSS